MSKSKSSVLSNAAEGLAVFSDYKETHEVQQVQDHNVNNTTKVVQEVQDAQQVQHVYDNVSEQTDRPLGTTQGRKGQKAKRINMAFSDTNHRFITMESRRRGLSATMFVNQIIDEYRESR